MFYDHYFQKLFPTNVHVCCHIEKYAETKCDSARYKIFPVIEFFALCTFRNSCFFNYFGGRLSMGTKDNYIFVDFYKRYF